MKVALVSQVFFEDPDNQKLSSALLAAAGGGAELAVLPELPLNEWSPYSKDVRDADAEDVAGPRQERMSDAARLAGIGLVGGAIVRDPESGKRYNTALVYDASGLCIGAYRKVHLPEEEGYWETSHYEAGEAGPEVVTGFSMPIGLQICSDVNRPQGFQLLAAQGAQLMIAPRATPPETYDRWRLILRSNALMSGAYLISVNRQKPEHGASIGGPSVAIDPDGEMLVETGDQLAFVDLRPDVLAEAAKTYPGYLDRFPGVYADAWEKLTERE